MREPSLERLILDGTSAAAAPLVPEISLRLATSDTTLWHATEAWLSERNVPPPFWAFAWPGGLALARYVLDNPDLVRGLRVLDLGAGSGLVGIACAIAGAREVLACDSDPIAREACRINAANNAQRVAIAEDITALAFDPGCVVVAADVFYDQKTAAAFMPIFARARDGGAGVWVADPRRPYFCGDSFTRVASYEVQVPLGLESREIMATDVYVMK